MTSVLPRVRVGTLDFDPLTEVDVVERVLDALTRGEGGWISTPNIDILRRSAEDGEVRRLVSAADLVVADGAPVVWAARLGGRPLPERVAGSALLWSLSAAAARAGRGIYLLGGEPGVADRAAARLSSHAPGLRVTGTYAPPWGFESDPAQIHAIRGRLLGADPAVVFVGLGCPKQERLIATLAPSLPRVWWIGCGAALAFAAGQLQRAPAWMQASGLEWVHRMAAEPRRLGRRYLVDDAPYALRLLAGSALARLGPTASTATPARKRAVQVLSAGVGRLTRRADSAAMFHGVQSPCQLPIARTSSQATSYRPVVIAASRAAAGPSGNRSTRAHSVDQKATVRKGYRPDLVDTSHGGHRAFERTVVVPPAPSVDRQRGLDENLQMVPKSTVDGSRDEDFWEVRVREAAQCCGLRPDQPPGQLVEPYLGEAEQAAVAPEQLQDRLAVCPGRSQVQAHQDLGAEQARQVFGQSVRAAGDIHPVTDEQLRGAGAQRR